jgi:2-(1,2-epoxy-1,2-dihydrophenyl)acetyl-CoA isomerase
MDVVARTQRGVNEMTVEQSADRILLEVDSGVATVTLNRVDRLNAVDWDMASRLIDMFEELRQRDDVRAVLLTGAGRSFCAGGDLGWVESDSLLGERTVPRAQRKSPFGPFAGFTQAIISVDKPVIAALHGHVVGAGLVWALACDRRFADATTRVSAIFVKRGVAPELGLSFFLPRIVGVSMALKMVTTGAWLDAQAALQAGVIDELFPAGGAFPAALEYARELARGPSVAVDMARRVIYKSLTATLEETLDYELYASSVASGTADAKEGVKAFLDKREPDFRGE